MRLKLVKLGVHKPCHTNLLLSDLIECTQCHKELDRDQFPKLETESKRICNDCLQACVRKSQLAKFEITEEDYQRILKSQGGICAICKNRDSRNLAVDHDHETGKIRGLLCSNCNRGLGRFKDSAERLQSAIDYLKVNNGD